MIITRTPFRVSFVGGGSDLPSFYRKSPGAVLSTSINKYMYISAHEYFEDEKYLLKYSKTELVKDINKISNSLFKECIKLTSTKPGVEISSSADIPSGTGLGSSSSFTVGALNSLFRYNGKERTKLELAKDACNIELDILKEPIGKQDQYAAAIGGLNKIKFNSDESVDISPVKISSKKQQLFEQSSMMIYTGSTRSASEILETQNNNINSNMDKFETQKEMVNLVDEIIPFMQKGDTEKFGNCLNKNWILKTKLSNKISNSEVDKIYGKSLKYGAYGGKLLGAGGSGFLFICFDSDQRNKFTELFKDYKQVSFGFDKEGSRLVYDDSQ